MDLEQLNFIKKFIRENLIFVSIFCIGLIFLVIGVIQFLGQNGNSVVFERNPQNQSDASTDKAQNESVWIDISGSVMNPGVYQLPPDSRLKDALVKAGGLNSDADRDYVSKSLNLAKKLTDGEKIYIPKVGERVVLGSTAPSSTININTASVDELDKLPGIGAVTAEKIINSRPYSSIQELLDKKVVSSSVFEKIKDKIAVN